MPDLVTSTTSSRSGPSRRSPTHVLGQPTGIPVRRVDEGASGGAEGGEQVAGVLGRGARAPRHRPETQPRDGETGGAEAAGEHGGDPIARPLATVGAMRLAISCGYAGMGLGNDTLELVREAERLGYEQAWVAEAYGSDAPTVLAWLAGQTSTIGLGAGVMQIPARTPAMTAMTAATLDTLSGGRFHLGLGVSGPQVSEGWHGVRFAAPLARTREYVEVVRMALRRDQVRVCRGALHAAAARRPGQGAAAHHPPAARRPADLPRGGRAAEPAPGRRGGRRLARHLRVARALRRPARRRCGPGARRPGPGDAPTTRWPASTSWPPCRSSSPTTSRRPGRPLADYTALYIGGMGSREQNFYNALARRMGFEEAADTIQDLYLDGRPRDAADAVPFELVDSTALIGPPERIAERIGRYADCRRHDAERGAARGDHGGSRSGAARRGGRAGLPDADSGRAPPRLSARARRTQLSSRPSSSASSRDSPSSCPISSTGHLTIAEQLLGLPVDDPAITALHGHHPDRCHRRDVHLLRRQDRAAVPSLAGRSHLRRGSARTPTTRWPGRSSSARCRSASSASWRAT